MSSVHHDTQNFNVQRTMYNVNSAPHPLTPFPSVPMSSPSPLSLYLLSNCPDISMSTFHVMVERIPLTQESYNALGDPKCSPTAEVPDGVVYPTPTHGSVALVEGGELNEEHSSVLLHSHLDVPPTSDFVHFGVQAAGPVRYEVGLGQVQHRTVDGMPVPQSALDDEHWGAGMELYRVSVAGGPKEEYMPRQGYLKQGRFDFGLRFHCRSGEGYYDSEWQGVIHTQVNLEIRTWDRYTLEEFKPLIIPFKKTCDPPDPEIGWWNGGYGTPDDMGHLAGGLPLIIYGLILMLNFMGRLKSRGRIVTRVFGTPPYIQNGYLDTTVLIISGALPAMIHFNTLTSTNPSTHELYHFLAHLFTLSLGLLSLTTRLVIPRVPDLSLPVNTLCVAGLFTFHMQHDGFSRNLHLVYALVMAGFSVARIATMWEPKVGVMASWMAVWSGTLICVASEDGVRWEKHVALDVPATAMVAGMVGALVICLVAILVRERGNLDEGGSTYERVGLVSHRDCDDIGNEEGAEGGKLESSIEMRMV